LVIVKDAFALRLDTSALDVRAVAVDGTAASFTLTVPDPSKPHLGSCLEIDFGAGAAEGDEKVVEIKYNTSPDASAAQWLPPSQTAGKEHPYVFSACFVRNFLQPNDCLSSNCIPSHTSAMSGYPREIFASLPGLPRR